MGETTQGPPGHVTKPIQGMRQLRVAGAVPLLMPPQKLQKDGIRHRLQKQLNRQKKAYPCLAFARLHEIDAADRRRYFTQFCGVCKHKELGVPPSEIDMTDIPLATVRLPGTPMQQAVQGDEVTMLVHDVEQGTPEWFALRLGIPTASQFCKIITSQGRPSRQADAYLNVLLTELATVERNYCFIGSYWTERGKELEPEAVQYYEREMKIRTVKVGFVTDLGRTMGCSPDRLVGTDGLLEVKCPAPHTHVDYLRRQKIDMRYYPQVQGQLLITGRKWVDFLSYHPDQPPLRVRVFRDEPYLATLKELLRTFVRKLDQRRNA